MEINRHEIEVLEMLNGERQAEWGAWVSVCLEYLSEAGLCTRGPKYQINQAGKAALASSRNKRRESALSSPQEKLEPNDRP